MDIEEQEVDSLTADLAAAWDASEEDDGGTTEGSEVPESNAEPVTGRWATEQPSGAESGGADNGDGVHAEEKQGVGEQAGSEDSEKPPVGLSPEAREAWGETPAAVRADIAKREADYAAGIEKHRVNTERVRAMDQTLQPYQQLFAMNGGPQNTLPGLLQTASLLQMGSAPQKAQAVANLIKQFGVDIQTLDNMLVGGEAPQEVQQQTQIQQMLDQRLQPLQQQLQSYQQREQVQQQEAQQQIGNELQEFGQQNEFYADVRAEMADLLDMAANRGRNMTLEEAYKTACAAHPQISNIMANRQSQQAVAGKRQAASSIHGSAGADLRGAAPDSITSALNAAWDNVGRM